jgi:hypothetical protein
VETAVPQRVLGTPDRASALTCTYSGQFGLARGRVLVAAPWISVALADRPPSHLFNRVVLAAPDVEVDLFRRRMTTFARLAGRTTLYASSADKALEASLRFHQHRRAGQGAPDIVVMPGQLDSVDATAMSTDFLAHSYFGDHSSVIGDLFALLRHGHGPEDRYGLLRRGQWWGCPALTSTPHHLRRRYPWQRQPAPGAFTHRRQWARQ